MVFLSHKNDPDHPRAREVAAKLRDLGVSCWLAPESIGAGRDFASEITGAINTCEVFVILLSRETVQSVHVRKELMLAISHRKTVIPLKIGDFELDDAFEYLLADIQMVPFRFSEADYRDLAARCRLGERVVRMEISKNPRRNVTVMKGDFQENMDRFIRDDPGELDRTVFAMGIDCTSRLDISSTGGILKWVVAYLNDVHGVSMDELQRLIGRAKVSQLQFASEDQPLQFKDIVLIRVPLSRLEHRGTVPVLRLLLVANSRKKASFSQTGDVDEVEGIDSREIIIAVFNKCRELGEEAANLFIGAMGTNGLAFPYEVITSQVLNCFVYSQRMDTRPLNLFYSVRQADMEKAGLTTEEILSYITTVVHFFRE